MCCRQESRRSVDANYKLNVKPSSSLSLSRFVLKCVFLPTTVANERNRARKKDVRDRHTSLLFHRPPEADDFIFPRFLIAPTHVIRSCVTWFPLINTPKLYSGAREKKVVFPGSGWWSTHASTYSNKQDWISRLMLLWTPPVPSGL